MSNARTRLPEVLKKHESDLLSEWIKEQSSAISRQGVLKDGELREQATQFLRLLQETAQKANVEDINGPAWDPIKEFLGNVSRSCALQGFSPSETATFVFSIKRPLFSRLRKEVGHDAQALGEETWLVTELLDKLGLFTTEMFQRSREEVISRQQQELLELSTQNWTSAPITCGACRRARRALSPT